MTFQDILFFVWIFAILEILCVEFNKNIRTNLVDNFIESQIMINSIYNPRNRI